MAVSIDGSYRLLAARYLRKQAKQPGVHLFRGRDMDLLVCGIGAERMYDGIHRYFHTADSRDFPYCLNFGIAGTRLHPIGELVWANRIGDRQIGLPDFVTGSRPLRVRSLDQPSTQYQSDVLFDMEAEAWLESISENIQQFQPEHLFCAKVISDNPSSGIQGIDKKRVEVLVRSNIRPLGTALENIIKKHEDKSNK